MCGKESRASGGKLYLRESQSERERCRLQMSQTDLQAQYRPESGVLTVYFLPAQCSDMSTLFSVFPVELLIEEVVFITE